MPKTIERKQGDTGPSVIFQITQDGSPANLTGASVTLLAKPKGASTLTINKQLTNVDWSIGKFEYTPGATDFQTPANLQYELEITLSNGVKYTAPSKGFGLLVISNDLNSGD